MSIDGIKLDPSHIKIIEEFKAPKNQPLLQQFLGFCNHYRRFVLMHSECINPFRELLKKDATWLWTKKHSEAFNKLKKIFSSSVCLSHAIPDAPFKVQTDASCVGIEGILSQIDNENNHRIISIANRCLTSTESRYMTTKMELLAIVYCVEKFRDYLIGTKFEIITDHKSLVF